jgi:hypothetical protein
MPRAELAGLQLLLKNIEAIKPIIHDNNYDIVIGVDSRIVLAWLTYNIQIRINSVTIKYTLLENNAKRTIYGTFLWRRIRLLS